MTKPNNSLLLVPEPLLKRRHDLEDLKRKRQAAAKPTAHTRASASGKKSIYVKKPETFLQQARSRLHNHRRFKRVLRKGMQTRASDDKQVDPETGAQLNSVGASIVFCVRIRDHVGAPKTVRRVLSTLRLRNLHEGVFLRYDDAMRRRLHLIEPYVVYGPPTPAVVEDLILRRGYGKVDGQRVALSDNNVIEDNLGEAYNILSVQDLVHELCNVGEAFGHVSKFLWPFRLSDHKTHFERSTLKVKDGKDYGDKGDAINEYIQEVL